MPIQLHLADDPPPERADAARNRQTVLAAALRLVDHCGVDAVSMDAVAAAAGVGKGTLFRGFGSRQGLMAAVLNQSETEWQAAVLSGPAPLGPGAPPMERLLAFGHTRLHLNLTHSALIRASVGAGSRSYAAVSFSAMHVRYLLGQLEVTGDIALLATSLLAPLEVVILEQQVHQENISTDRIEAAWDDLVRRVVG